MWAVLLCNSFYTEIIMEIQLESNELFYGSVHSKGCYSTKHSWPFKTYALMHFMIRNVLYVWFTVIGDTIVANDWLVLNGNSKLNGARVLRSESMFLLVDWNDMNYLFCRLIFSCFYSSCDWTTFASFKQL